MQPSALRPAQPMQSRTFAAVIEYRAHGENWGTARHTVTLTSTPEGIAAQVDGQAAPLADAVSILDMADRVEVLAEVPATPPTIGKARAARLHRLMGRLGLCNPDHYGSAARAVGREVFSLATLTEAEARAVWAYLCHTLPQARQLAA
ncbi:hypothetical protein Dcar01_02548 [Deinococcus carri]|uniref:Uncharacterized protein n=1 Tax=Deinococcus carri TaxID=1211323 RepID=A0ABP9WBF3_9DEIO